MTPRSEPTKAKPTSTPQTPPKSDIHQYHDEFTADSDSASYQGLKEKLGQLMESQNKQELPFEDRARVSDLQNALMALRIQEIPQDADVDAYRQVLGNIIADLQAAQGLELSQANRDAALVIATRATQSGMGDQEIKQYITQVFGEKLGKLCFKACKKEASEQALRSSIVMTPSQSPPPQ